MTGFLHAFYDHTQINEHLCSFWPEIKNTINFLRIIARGPFQYPSSLNQ